MATAPRAKTAPKIQLDFTFEKSTTNTVRYAEEGVAEGERAVVGTLYITKKALAEANLGDVTELTVTIEAKG